MHTNLNNLAGVRGNGRQKEIMKNFNLINVQMAKVAVVIFAFSCMLAFTSCSEEYKAKKCVKEFVEASIKKDKKSMR